MGLVEFLSSSSFSDIETLSLHFQAEDKRETSSINAQRALSGKCQGSLGGLAAICLPHCFCLFSALEAYISSASGFMSWARIILESCFHSFLPSQPPPFLPPTWWQRFPRGPLSNSVELGNFTGLDWRAQMCNMPHIVTEAICQTTVCRAWPSRAVWLTWHKHGAQTQSVASLGLCLATSPFRAESERWTTEHNEEKIVLTTTVIGSQLKMLQHFFLLNNFEGLQFYFCTDTKNVNKNKI